MERDTDTLTPIFPAPSLIGSSFIFLVYLPNYYPKWSISVYHCVWILPRLIKWLILPPLHSLLMVMVSKNILMIGVGQFNFNQGWRCLIVISRRKVYSCPLILYSFQKLRWSCLASNVDFNFFHARPMKEKIACTLHTHTHTLSLSLSLSLRISTSYSIILQEKSSNLE